MALRENIKIAGALAVPLRERSSQAGV